MVCRMWFACCVVVCCLSSKPAVLLGEESSLRIPATEPADALSTFRLQPGFELELIAAEPLVTDPIAMVVDEAGLAYVAEMNDYPYSDAEHDRPYEAQTSEPIGKIRVLKDDDDDGVYDRSWVFADQLSWPSGVAVWKGGLFVAATPDLWYLKDTDGDMIADVRRKVFTGFRKYNVQAVMNNLQWGLDQHMYAAGSSNGGSIEPGGASDIKPLLMRRHDFRFDPTNESIELLSGGARFGHAMDDWGNRFLCNIRNPVQHVVMPARYLGRNPYNPVVSAIQDASESGDQLQVFPSSRPEPWRVENARRQAASGPGSLFDSTVPAGYVTSSSGITLYRGQHYDGELHGNAVIGEVAGNLVMRYQVQPDGVTFSAQRAHQGSEFLTSTDNWFRPVNFYNAPDGSLLVLDMYRETIEHPWSMPDDLKALVDLTSGRDRGRIYRVVKSDGRPDSTGVDLPLLSDLNTQQLVSELASDIPWRRDTAHRLLFEQQDPAAAALLSETLQSGEQPVTRLLALWSLHGLNGLTESLLLTALNDQAAPVREHAVRLAESRLSASSSLRQRVYELAADPADRVRFQVALTIGEHDDPAAIASLERIALAGLDDRWQQAAVISSIGGREYELFAKLLQNQEPATLATLINPLATAVAATAEPDQIDQVLSLLPPTSEDNGYGWENQLLNHLGRGLSRQKLNWSKLAGDLTSASQLRLDRALATATDIAMSDTAETSQRLDAITFLSQHDLEVAFDPLSSLLEPQRPLVIQQAAIDALSTFADSQVAELFLATYPTLTPEMQVVVVGKLRTRTPWLLELFAAIEAGQVNRSLIAPVYRTIYSKSSNDKVRQYIETLYGDERTSPRSEVITAYQPELTSAGDLERGRLIFRRECQSCHQHEGVGQAVGPNLATVTNRTGQQLLIAILDPNREVSPAYLQYSVVTSDGRVRAGIIAAESPTTITLKQAENKTEDILRTDIEQIQATGLSLMPEGIEKKITPAEMRDLITFLQNK